MIPSDALGVVLIVLAIAVIVRLVLNWRQRNGNGNDRPHREADKPEHAHLPNDETEHGSEGRADSVTDRMP